MLNEFSRTELLIGKEAMQRLYGARVAVFGIGGVGGYVVEALARSGVGAFDLIDDDKVCLTNINRQIIATRKTIGKYKVDVMEERVHSINPEAQVTVHKCFYLPETADQFDFTQYDYVVDAVDTVTAKLEIIMRAKEAGVPVISCMGAGNKLDPTQFHVADIYKTTMCPLAKVMRRELKKRGVKKLKVVYSTEASVKPLENMENSCRTGCVCPPGTKHKCTDRRAIPGSISFVPSVAGLILAGEVIKDLIAEDEFPGTFSSNFDSIGQSKESADKIRGIVENLISNSNQSVEIMNGVVGEIHQQNEKLGTTLNVFSTLNQEVQKVVGEINVISGELDHIENYKTDVVEKIDGLTEISQNNAASPEEPAATMDQLAEIVEDCRQATAQLNVIADELNANAKKFQL